MLTNKIVGTVLAALGTALAAAAFTAALLLGAGTARAAVVDDLAIGLQKKILA